MCACRWHLCSPEGRRRKHLRQISERQISQIQFGSACRRSQPHRHWQISMGFAQGTDAMAGNTAAVSQSLLEHTPWDRPSDTPVVGVSCHAPNVLSFLKASPACARRIPPSGPESLSKKLTKARRYAGSMLLPARSSLPGSLVTYRNHCLAAVKVSPTESPGPGIAASPRAHPDLEAHTTSCALHARWCLAGRTESPRRWLHFPRPGLDGDRRAARVPVAHSAEPGCHRIDLKTRRLVPQFRRRRG